MARVITQRTIDSIKPAGRRFGVRDGLVPGLQLRIHPTGIKTFALFTRVGGRLINLKIGSAATMSLGEARARAKAILVEAANGIDPRKPKPDATRPTVEAVARDFIARYVMVRNRRPRDVESRIEREIIARWGRRPIDEITRADVVAMLDAIVDRGAPVAANRTLAAARKLFSWAVARGILSHSPCVGVKAPSKENKRDRVLTDNELALIWKGAGTLNGPFGAFLRLLILTGQRRDEVAAMRWAELDPALTLWSLPPARTKNKVAHQVPLVPAAAAIIAARPRIGDSPFVFTVDGRTPVNGYSYNKAILDRVVTKLNGGVPLAAWRLHDCRRTAVTNLAALGAQLPVVERLINHVSGSFSGPAGVYQKFDFAAEKRAALMAWSDFVLARAVKRRDWPSLELKRQFDEFMRRPPSESRPRLTRRPDTGRHSKEDDDLGWEISLPPRAPVLSDPPKKPKKPQKGKARGAPRDYDYDAIRQTAGQVAAACRETQALPRSNNKFMELVRTALETKRILVPELTLLKKLTAPIFKNAKRHRDKSRQPRGRRSALDPASRPKPATSIVEKGKRHSDK